MKISRSIFLTFLSLVLLLPSGCYMSQYRGSGKLDTGAAGYRELKPFQPGFEKALYQASLSVSGREFSGLVMIKAFDGGRYRVAFFNELGLNFFDFELVPDRKKNRLELITNNIYAPLDRRILLNSFEKYFSMLLGPGLDEGVHGSYLKKDGSMVMVSVHSYKGRDAYLSKNLIEPYSGIVNLAKLTGNDRISIAISPKKADFSPENIRILQPGLRLELEMELVE